MNRAICVVLVAAAALAISPPAGDAQPRFEISLGPHYTYRPPEPTLRDWFVAGGFRINRVFDLVAEVAWDRRGDLRPVYDDDGKLRGARSATDHYLQIAGGIRGRLTQERRLIPFYKALVGVVTFSPTRHRHQNRLDVLSPWDGSIGLFFLQAGAGLDVAVRSGLKVRFAGDLMMQIVDGYRHDAPRASVGIVAPF